MKKILISDKLAQAGIDFLNAQAGLEAHFKIGLTEAELCAIIGDYDA